MPNTFTPTDVYSIVNAMSDQMFGTGALAAVDTSSFVSIGEKMLRTGVTNTLDALAHVLGETTYAVRRYNGRFKILFVRRNEYGGIERKISFYAKGLQPTGFFNTDLNPAQLDDGQSIDHYVINKKYPLEINFIGIKTEEYEDTTFLVQLRQAFRSEDEFGRFVAAKLVDIANDLETKVEANNRLMILNAIGATYNVGTARQKVNLTAEFNAKYGTTYTTAQLQTTYLKEFAAFMVARMKGDMELMRERNTMFHIFSARNDDSGNALVLPRHTPPEARRLMLYMPLIRDVETSVFPSLFKDSYVKLENYESVEYWQSPQAGSTASVSITPNQLDVTTGQAIAGSAVTLNNVVGLLYDRDALEVTLKLESVLTTPVNARGKYYNTYYSWAYMFKQDQTENMIVYYMAD